MKRAPMPVLRAQFDREAGRAENCEIGVGTDPATGDMLLQFDQHVRCLRLAPQAALELIEAIWNAGAKAGVFEASPELKQNSH